MDVRRQPCSAHTNMGPARSAMQLRPPAGAPMSPLTSATLRCAPNRSRPNIFYNCTNTATLPQPTPKLAPGHGASPHKATPLLAYVYPVNPLSSLFHTEAAAAAEALYKLLAWLLVSCVRLAELPADDEGAACPCMAGAPEPPVSAELLACNCGTGCAGCVLMGDSSSLPVPPTSCELRGSARALEHDRCTGQTDSTQHNSTNTPLSGPVRFSDSTPQPARGLRTSCDVLQCWKDCLHLEAADPRVLQHLQDRGACCCRLGQGS